MRNGLLCALLVAACALASYPVSAGALIDDFSYVKTVFEFARTGHMIYNGWATAMLGWMIPWSALFVKLLGLSFLVVRLSLLPLDFATVYLFYHILIGFGIHPRNAIYGTLTLGLSPLFLPLGTIYMSDVPGILVVLLCIWMCQRAAAASSDRAAVAWLCSAALVNVLGGTVRQIAWLGALLIVPSTSWLLRERRGVRTAAILSWILSIAGVELCMRWFAHQPYSVPESLSPGPVNLHRVIFLAIGLAQTLLCLLFVCFPVLVAWAPCWPKLGKKARILTIGGMALCVAAWAVEAARGVLYRSLLPWLPPVLATDIPGGNLSFAIRLILSAAIVWSAFIFFALWLSCREQAAPGMDPDPALKTMAWMLGPYFVGYVLLLVPRGIRYFIQDRYVLGLMPVAIVVLLAIYQRRVAPRVPAFAILVIAAFAAFGIAETHDFFARNRALESLLDSARAAGIRRASIQAGLASDGWAQLQNGGHINDPRIKNPPDAYNPNIPALARHIPCLDWFAPGTPSIVPAYIVADTPDGCGAVESPPVQYLAWMPPFHRAVYLERLPRSHR